MIHHQHPSRSLFSYSSSVDEWPARWITIKHCSPLLLRRCHPPPLYHRGYQCQTARRVNETQTDTGAVSHLPDQSECIHLCLSTSEPRRHQGRAAAHHRSGIVPISAPPLLVYCMIIMFFMNKFGFSSAPELCCILLSWVKTKKKKAAIIRENAGMQSAHTHMFLHTGKQLSVCCFS